ncbi:lymphokine-activated killer T-cell-originated protein kinase-like isoform X1 [Amphibalanus amphitrite]|nr:lymphokine-activated killer T-cell-originated protein kinase-like isoform X1 [Amphibalanus amphitrite]XP_043194056.1 lymphokine-activated killer T-cell-originated protein kinase-like isoform X1 [Amphibalanus amphitrite]
MADNQSDIFKTPSKPARRRASKQWNEILIPESPMMKVIGYGTGINVSLLERGTPRRITQRSPWAVKRLSRRVHVAPEQAARLAREAELLRRLRHPCVVGYRGVAAGSAPGSVALLMEAASASLMDLIETRAESEPDPGPFPLSAIATVGLDIASALHYLHTDQHLLHGDLKSANVLVFGAFQRAKLCDFGVSLPLNNQLAVTGDQTYVGTEPWSAPEVVFDGDVTHKTDIYSYALTLWEMFALEMPHASDLPDLDNSELSSDSEMDDSTGSDGYFESQMGVPPPVPQLGAALMAEYRPFVEIYTVCSAVRAGDRPAAEQCCHLFRPLCPRPETDGKAA